MMHVLQRGQALVITGPEGSGKTTIARATARNHGSFAEMDAKHLVSPFFLSNLLVRRPATIIVEGIPNARDMLEVKELLSEPTMVVRPKFKPEVTVRTPNFIFCSGQLDAVRVSGDSRRFFVITTPATEQIGWSRHAGKSL